MRLVTLLVVVLIATACGGQRPVPVAAIWTDHVPTPPPDAREADRSVPGPRGGTWLLPISPTGAEIGVDYGYVTPHCGIRSPIDVDGSFWDPVGEPADSVEFAGRVGTVRLDSPTEATFTSDDGAILRLVRHAGAKDFPGCD